MTDELKPCPFCGNDWPSIASNKAGTILQVHCLSCGVTMALQDTKEEAIAAWNKRQGENDAEELCAKLNRLAALEACLRDIAENGEILDAQKAQAVLEEACEGTATEDFSELRANKKYAEILKKMKFTDDNGHPLELCEDFVDMCERWQKLEAAVAFRGLDEMPEITSPHHPDVNKKIDLLRSSGEIIYDISITLHSANYWRESGFTGWRYPVGDMSE